MFGTLKLNWIKNQPNYEIQRIAGVNGKIKARFERYRSIKNENNHALKWDKIIKKFKEKCISTS